MRAIDADALKEDIEQQCALLRMKGNNELNQISMVLESGFMAQIDKMPTIEPKTGKWEERKVSSERVIDEWQSARCSVCGRYDTRPYLYYFDEPRFCSWCGADMRG